jgi:hypothetical protein
MQRSSVPAGVVVSMCTQCNSFHCMCGVCTNKCNGKVILMHSVRAYGSVNLGTRGR